jgi:hypothetical protein
MGCLGCGCLVLALLVILFLGLAGGGAYLAYTKFVAATSATPAAVPSFDGGDDLYQSARQKLADFDHDVKNHQAATIQLSADEINTLIARNPAFIQMKFRLFVTLTNDQARIQGGIPTGILTRGMLNDRYLNFDTTLSPDFDSESKSLNFTLHHLQIGDQTMPEKGLPTTQIELTQILNAELQQNPDAKDFLDQVKSIGVKDGELVMETQ